MLKIEKVSFAYNEIPVLNNINFRVEEGENSSIIGSSGCGKSTLLQLIYGLHDSQGKIFWKQKELLGPKFNLVPGEPFIKYLAQDFDLMPPLSVEDNVGKYLSNMYPIKKKRRIKELLEVVEMEDFAKAKAKTLSGGQQQRVALARALADEPELLLLDEPFSHIDHFRKNNLRRRLFAYLKERKVTCLIATHDIADALSFASQTIVLKNGEVHAKATPGLLYSNPKDAYVASLFGDVNNLSLKNLVPSEKSRKKVLLYPNEIKVVSKSHLTAQVLQSYFEGGYFLVKAELKEEIIYFKHSKELAKGELVGVEISGELINSRIRT